ncbi:aminomethyltransferase [Kaistia sp. 32K]|uniref:CAF17-like 4Fe-4S cluster assembly/insertion protein YgfZ n=1 Tax=Kaistia sp. 32K TaxID=2795690 RepID=UPI00191620FA|nr:folate-binding protein YgfZ [Kaistia sp. 32K]BCP52638.1 aminomethyltransferase [Kaistia sp. 32K]
MRNGSYAQLTDRGTVFIGGPEAETFLQNIVTTDMAAVQSAGAGFGALLSPQGKILFDFIILPTEGGYLFDLPRALVADFQKRMTLYRLRAKVEIANRSDSDAVYAFWGSEELPAIEGPVARDPRLAALGFRAILPVDATVAVDGYAAASEADYHAWRTGLTVPEGGRDFAFGDAFPHDVDMDDLGGLDFRKGCYVGQEIVSRMEHRGTARRRAVAVTSEAALPPAGSPIEADGKPIGTLGGSYDTESGKGGIGLIRLDRARRALDQGIAVTAEGVPLAISLPPFARFGWPSGDDEGAA